MRRLAVIGLAALAGGCTTMQAATTLAPYTKDKQQRNAVEAIAETYCRDQRGQPGTPAGGTQPDYLFTTDGCSRWPDDDWVACCVAHDMAYWCGGSAMDRADADLMLWRCVNERHPLMGTLMYTGVRIAGGPWLPTPWRWGYGWLDWPRGYDRPDHPRTVSDVLRSLRVPAVLDEQFKHHPQPRGATETHTPDSGGG